MKKNKEMNPGDELESRLFDAIRDFHAAPLPGTRVLPVLTGISTQGLREPQENVLARVKGLLVGTKRVFRHDNRVAYETRVSGNEPRLRPLAEDGDVKSGAEYLLANLIECRNGDNHLVFPRWLANLALRGEPVLAALPEIRVYAHRPVFNEDLILCDPGWHPDCGILVHGPAVDPIPWPIAPPGCVDLERLPHHLRALLTGFCFRDEVDRVNALGLFLTGLLVDRYVETGKGVALIDGNQPGVGKTLLARAIGVILDGEDPGLVPFSSEDEELKKSICAGLRTRHSSVLIIDNAKTATGAALNSHTLDMLTTAPRVELRILRESINFSRNNDLLWILTMNDTCASRDLVTRGIPVRLAYDGDPGDRVFSGPNPIDYSRRNRVEILGELAGMVEHWKQRGRPLGPARHRFAQWASEIGGILDSCGLPGFLTNFADVVHEFTSGVDEMAVLAEFVARKGTGPIGESNALPAAGWVKLCEAAGVREESLKTVKGDRAKTIKLGQAFAPYLQRSTTITVGNRIGTAVLRTKLGRARQKLYYFDISLIDPACPVAQGDPPPRPNTRHARPPRLKAMTSAILLMGMATRNFGRRWWMLVVGESSSTTPYTTHNFLFIKHLCDFGVCGGCLAFENHIATYYMAPISD